MKNDVQMQQDVLVALEREQHSVTRTVGVEVHHGVVKLAGNVGDDATKRRAERAAQGVDGVTHVLMDVDVSSGRPAPHLDYGT